VKAKEGPSRPISNFACVTIKELSTHLQVKPAVLRSMLAAGLIPGKKHKGTWVVESEELDRIEQAFRLLRGPVSEPVSPPADGACPSCHTPGFLPSQGSGWGEFLECQECKFSIHQHNMDSAPLVQRAVQAHRSALREKTNSAGRWIGGGRHSVETDFGSGPS